MTKNKKIILIIISVVLVLVLISVFPYEEVIREKQGTLLSVTKNTETTFTLVFSDGFSITLKEDKEDIDDMVVYMNNWVNEEIIIEYYVNYESNELKSVNPGV